MDYSTDGRGNREALAVAKRALIQNPRYAPALVTMARAEMKTGFLRGWEFRRENLERAHELLNRAEKLDPNLPRIAMVRGWVFTFQKNYREARKLADQASRKDPKNPYLLSLYMELDEREQKFDELLARARTFVESTDEVGRRDVVYRQLISVYNSRREWDASERMHRSLLNLKPDSAWVRGNFAGFLSWRGKHDEAIAMGKAALAKADYGAGRITLADCYARKAKSILDSAGPSEEIEELLEEAEKETRFSAETFYVRGLFHEKLGNPLRARLSFEAALKIDKDHRGVKHALKRD
jgi:Tfp pilus assembly protein PilF